MDYHKVLKLLIDFNENKSVEVNDEKLKQRCESVYPSIPENIVDEILRDRHNINISDDNGWKYLHIILYVIKILGNTEFAEESALFTVDQFRVIKIAIEVAVCIGILPSLLPQIKIHASTVHPRNFKLNLDNHDTFEKYKIITHTTNMLLEFFNNNILRAAVMSQLDCLLAALLQLSHAPLRKPTEITSNSLSSSELEMTLEKYIQLKEEQECFQKKLNKLIEDCPQPLMIKELIVILAIKNNPKWLQLHIKNYLTKRIMLPNGVAALTAAICDDVSDLGKSWEKLDITARLVATSHGPDSEEYYTSVCSQILKMLCSKTNKQEVIIATCCIKALYDYKQDICVKEIIQAVMEPLLFKLCVVNKHSVVKTEEEVSHCIENLCKLFLSTEAEFKCLPTELLLQVSVPLFYLYIVSYRSIFILRSQVRQLLLKILSIEIKRETLFSVFLGHQIFKNHEYGGKLNFRFGTNGGLEIISESPSIDYEELTDCLFNLVEKDETLSFNLFTYLLEILPKLNDTTSNAAKGKLLETPEDIMERIEKHVTAVKLLTVLSSSTLVQKAQIKNPKPLLEFTKFFFSKLVSNYGSDDTLTYDQDSGILYTSLMLIKIIITDNNINRTWETFQNYISSIRQEFDFKKVPSHVISLVEELEMTIRKKGKSYSKTYCDLSADNKNLSEFDKALADLADPLLPIRAHGIISLTKMIESLHPEAKMKKDLLLCIFQENLSHDDSFIYLAAVNGLCALSTVFPEKVLEILVQEFIGLTQQTKGRDITPETRAKLGEILVKTTRALGEVTPKYKSLLVNGFLSGTKDPEPIVRASSLSCLGEFCKIMGFRLGNLIIEILYCIGCIIKTDTDESCRRAGVLVATLLLRGLGKDALTELGANLLTLYRSLKHLRDNDKDPVLQLHAQLALEEFDDIVQQFLFAKPKLEKSIFLL